MHCLLKFQKSYGCKFGLPSISWSEPDYMSDIFYARGCTYFDLFSNVCSTLIDCNFITVYRTTDTQWHNKHNLQYNF